MEAVTQAITTGDGEAILAACSRLPAAGSGAVAELLGDWKVEWSSMQMKAKAKREEKQQDGSESQSPQAPPAVKLKFLSFGALPDVEVCIVDGYNRVSGNEKGGLYELFQVFTVPGFDGTTAAMVLGGPWADEEVSDGTQRAFVHFQTVTLVPSSSSREQSLEMLRAAGLGTLTPIPVKAPPTYIDVEYIDRDIRVHKGASGVSYILSRGSVPFASGGGA